MGRQPRQRPISCHLCRVRKLRCSRQFPCSNCTSRGVTCQHETVPSSPTASVSGLGSGVAEAKPASRDVTSAEVLSRLERLEALIAAQSQGQQPAQWHQSDATAAPSTSYSGSIHDTPTPVVCQLPDRMTTGRTQTNVSLSSMPPKLQRLTADALRIEQSWGGQSLLDSLVADPIIFRTCPIRLITKSSTFVFPNPSSSNLPDLSEPTRCIWLPQRDEANVLVRKYLKDITQLHHVIHTPSIPALIDGIYSALEQNRRADLGGLVLFLGICASATFNWMAHDDSLGLFSSSKEANSQATSWLKATWDAVDYACRTSHASIECTQGVIILFCVMWNIEGISPRARNIVSVAIAMCRELALHRIDDVNNAMVAETVRLSTIKTEIGRRIVWYLAGTDWMLAQFCVPQEGTYTIDPRHLSVRKPHNVDDEDLVEGKEIFGRPLTEPTCTSYLLQRLRLAEVCHSLLVQNPLMLLNPENVDYGQVLEMDTKFKQYLLELPEFFDLDNTSWKHLPPTHPQRTPSIVTQRYTLNLLISRQLCKLHLPYLARGTIEPAFAYSREVCLKSARRIIDTENELREEHLISFSPNLRLVMVLRSVFLASIALVLDACLQSDSGENLGDAEKMTEAWTILREAQYQSPTAAKLLELSIQVLHRHKPSHPALEGLQQKQYPNILSNTEGSLPMTPDSAHRNNSKITAQLPQVGVESETAYLEQQWQAFDSRMDLEAVDWNGLFWGLDAQFI